MQFFKTVGGMFSSAFEQMGEVDDNGNSIKATEQPMTEEKYIEYKKSKLRKKLSRFKT